MVLIVNYQEVNVCYDWRIIGSNARTYGMGKHLDVIPNKDELTIVTERNELLTYARTKNIVPNHFVGELRDLTPEEAMEHANVLNKKVNGILCAAFGVLETEKIKVFALVSHRPDHELKPKFLFYHNNLLLREREIKEIIEAKQKKSA